MTEKLQVKYAEKAIDSGSLKNSSEQLDLKFPAPITTAPSIMKNHTVVVEGIEEINDESKDDEVEAVIKASIDDGEEKARFKQIDSGSETSVTAMSEVLEAVNSDVKIIEVHRGREKVALEPPAKPPDTELKVVEQDKGSNWSCCKLGPTEKLMGQAEHSKESSVNFEWDILSKTNFLKEEFVLANSFFDVPVRASDFGVCHNNFFTLTDISIHYQFSLMFELNPYWLANERGMNIISQNKEKIVDILGYCGIYSIVAGVHEGNHLAFGNQSYKNLETLRENWLFLRAENRVVLESVGMAKPLDQGRLVEIFKNLRSSRLLMWICSRTLMSLFIACVNPPLSNEKEMKRYEMRFSVDTNDVLPTTLLEILMPMWKEVMGSLEGVKIGFAFAMSPLHAYT
ncbi:hypothetical protein TSUD_05170 [Trifolium subterraneum]|uniref:Uncharacterized protein n=1 Tax=Trifolium subterraneum TaxID=3900 RepID=A0A2Z6NVE8_TRISU|nr:hypothetical protein TSUD_05170 [Trifolium subterraneum]